MHIFALNESPGNLMGPNKSFLINCRVFIYEQLKPSNPYLVPPYSVIRFQENIEMYLQLAGNGGGRKKKTLGRMDTIFMRPFRFLCISDTGRVPISISAYIYIYSSTDIVFRRITTPQCN